MSIAKFDYLRKVFLRDAPKPSLKKFTLINNRTTPVLRRVWMKALRRIK